MTEPTDPKPAETTMADKPARKRRTKAEIEAANASDDSAKPKRGGRRSKADEAGEPAGAAEASTAPVAPSTPPEEIHRSETSVQERPVATDYDRPPASVQDAPPRHEGGGQHQQHPQQGGGNYQRRFDKFRFRDRRPQQGGGQQGGGNGTEGNRGPQFQGGGQRDRNDRGDRRDSGDQSGAQVYERDPNQPIEYSEGILELSGKGFGFLREAKRQFAQHPLDTFVTPEVCRRFNLRDGMWIKGETRRSNRGPQMYKLTSIHGEDPEKQRNIPIFEELTVINPKKRIKLETVPDRYTTRIMDLMTPIGKGQRGLLVAPPRTGKTTLLQHIGEAVVKNHEEIHLIILLVDERPEEVTELKRTVPSAELMASSNDSDLKSHTKIATLAMERAKRLVEIGKDVFILLDSITRVGRAFNNVQTGGRTMSGGIDARAMEIPRKIFAAARNTEEAGSLTIMATALIETGSRMDDVIFQEFKGTGNMELVLDRKISDQRIYPAVDIFQSGTRREELLLAEWELEKINTIRRGLAGYKPIEAIERLLSFMKKYPTNAQMLASIPG
jgi:transcription termination factor Rho